MPEINPQRVFALIVGISAYPDSDDWLPFVEAPDQDALRLYFADAHPGDPLNLELNNLLTYLSVNPKVRFPRQIVFVEACATFRSAIAPQAAHPLLIPENGRTPGQISQDVLTATKPGPKAGIGMYRYNGTPVPRGHFTEFLMRSLAKAEFCDNDRLWNSLYTFFKDVRGEFVRANHADPTFQVPRFEYTDRDGNRPPADESLSERTSERTIRHLTTEELQAKVNEYGRSGETEDFERFYRNWCARKPSFFVLPGASQHEPKEFVDHLVDQKLAEFEATARHILQDRSVQPHAPLRGYYAFSSAELERLAFDDMVAYFARKLNQMFTLGSSGAAGVTGDGVALAWSCVVVKIDIGDWKPPVLWMSSALQQNLKAFMQACQDFVAKNETCLLAFLSLQYTHPSSVPEEAPYALKRRRERIEASTKALMDKESAIGFTHWLRELNYLDRLQMENILTDILASPDAGDDYEDLLEGVFNGSRRQFMETVQDRVKRLYHEPS